MSNQKVQRFSAPKGVPDYYPPESNRFAHVREHFLHTAARAGYEHIELPIFEDTQLFARGVGESTDVVTKEMYTFEDRGGRSITLRPEGTAGVMRAVIEHGLDRGPLPVKLAYAGPCFRYERPQAGRYRQFQQLGAEAIGIDDPLLDAEIIAMADRFYKELGLTGYRLELNSLGDSTCRPQYREKLQAFLAGLDLDEATQQRAKVNPLRVLDDKRPEVQQQVANAPLMVDNLSDECSAHFTAVCGALDQLGVDYTLNPRLVRGLDYYTKTCFEFVHDGLGAQSGIGGGGRYDGLMGELGGQDLSGIGFGLGMERTLLALQVEEVATVAARRVDIMGVGLGSAGKQRLISIVDQLRAAHLSADMVYGDRGMKASMKAADRAGARIALIIGDSELEAGEAQLKDLSNGEQQSVSLDTIVSTAKAYLEAAE